MTVRHKPNLNYGTIYLTALGFKALQRKKFELIFVSNNTTKKVELSVSYKKSSFENLSKLDFFKNTRFP